MKKKVQLIILSILITLSANIYGQWTQVHIDTNISIYSIFFTNSNTGFAVGRRISGGIILRSNDAGQSWNTVFNSSNQFNSVYFPDSSTGYAVGMYGQIAKTIDGGVSWTYLTSTPAYDLNSVYFIDSNTGYVSSCCTDPGKIFKTVNGGISWITLDSSNTLMEVYGGASIYFTTPDTGYTVRVYLFRTTNGGSSWDSIASFPQIGFFSIYFLDKSIGFIAGAGSLPNPPWSNYGAIAKTTDSGLTWSTQTFNNIYKLFSIHFANSNFGYAVGGPYYSTGEGSILKTNDGGNTWLQSTILSNTPSYLFSVFCIDTCNCFVAGEDGIILKSDNCESVYINETTQSQNEINVSPNPASTEIFIKSNFDAPALFELYDITGRKVLKQTLTGINSQINISHLSNGFYIYKLEVQKARHFTGKIVKH